MTNKKRRELEQRLAAMESQRDGQRKRMEELQERKFALDRQMAALETNLERMDADIDQVEAELMVVLDQQQKGTAAAAAAVTVKPEVKSERADEILTDPASQAAMAMATQAEDEVLTEPQTMGNNSLDNEDDDDDDEIEEVYNRRPSSAGSGLGILQFTSSTATAAAAASSNHSKKKAPPPPQQQQQQQVENNPYSSSKPKKAKIDDFFQRKNPPPAAAATAAAASQLPLQPVTANQQQQSFDPNAQFRGDNFPWSQQVMKLLHETFRIPSFRDHQKEIINATLQQQDVFVIMRTGGGKSLTYQLPALLEGRHTNMAKVTFVISPLLSLIQDQVEQMNDFCPGSALSFTSNMPGGASRTRPAVGAGARSDAGRVPRFRDTRKGLEVQQAVRGNGQALCAGTARAVCD